jgi:hypothetical protein
MAALLLAELPEADEAPLVAPGMPSKTWLAEVVAVAVGSELDVVVV